MLKKYTIRLLIGGFLYGLYYPTYLLAHQVEQSYRADEWESESSVEEGMSKPVLRHSQGVHHINLQGGIGAIGYKGLVGWGLQLSTYTQLITGLGLEWKHEATTQYKNIFLCPVVSYNLVSKGNLYVNLLGGFCVVYNWYEEKKQNIDQSNLNIGTLLGVELALFITKQVGLTLGGGPIFFLLEDPYHRIDYQASLGLRFHL